MTYFNCCTSALRYGRCRRPSSSPRRTLSRETSKKSERQISTILCDSATAIWIYEVVRTSCWSNWNNVLPLKSVYELLGRFVVEHPTVFPTSSTKLVIGLKCWEIGLNVMTSDFRILSKQQSSRSLSWSNCICQLETAISYLSGLQINRLSFWRSLGSRHDVYVFIWGSSVLNELLWSSCNCIYLFKCVKLTSILSQRNDWKLDWNLTSVANVMVNKHNDIIQFFGEGGLCRITYVGCSLTACFVGLHVGEVLNSRNWCSWFDLYYVNL